MNGREVMKDGQCLCDGEDYSGTSTDILVIKHAHQGTQGQYTCTVERGQEKDMSQHFCESSIFI